MTERSEAGFPALRRRAFRRWDAMLSERQGNGWDSHWRDVAKHLIPRQQRFLASDRNRGGDRQQHIIDSAGGFAHRTLVAGMMAGMTSPARPWFALGLADSDLAERHEVKQWLAECSKIVLQVFRKSNTYNTLHGIYREISAYGTAASVMQEDFNNVIHHNPMAIGQYALGVNNKSEVDKMGREFELSVEETVGWFGLDNCSTRVRAAYDRADYGSTVEVMHLIEPNVEHDPKLLGVGGKAFRSTYWEKSDKSGEKSGCLRLGGYDIFPVLAPRWDVLWGDTYGYSPAMEALGDLKQLQLDQRRKDKAIDYQIDPPLLVPTELRGQAAFLPGEVSYYNGVSGNAVRTAFEVRLDPSVLLGDIADIRDRLNRAFYADLFLLLAQSDKRMTATEVAERHEEKLLMLGPVLERLHNELLSPLVVNTFTWCLRAGVLPQPPEALQNAELQVEYISVLAQAQRAVAVNSSDRLLAHVGTLVQLGKPEALDMIDADRSVEEYADALGVSPRLIVPGEQVALIRQQRAQAAQAQAQAQAAAAGAQALGALGGVQTGEAPGDNAASDLLSLFSGYGSQQPAGEA